MGSGAPLCMPIVCGYCMCAPCTHAPRETDMLLPTCLFVCAVFVDNCNGSANPYNVHACVGMPIGHIRPLVYVLLCVCVCVSCLGHVHHSMEQ